MGRIESRLARLEGRIGPIDDKEAERWRQQLLEDFTRRFEQNLAWVSPRVESGEVSVGDVEHESMSFAAALYTTLRFHGDPRADSAQEALEAKMRDMERRFPEAATSNGITRRLIEVYLEKLPGVADGT